MLITRRQTVALTAGALLGSALLVSRRALASVVYVEDKVAIDGSDAVAYFEKAGPVAGDPAITHDWNGATWRFATAANRDAFAAEPDRWAPQYGGYCAFAMANGQVASTIPEAWSIHEDKLYLNFNLDVRERWERDRDNLIVRADVEWPEVRATLA